MTIAAGFKCDDGILLTADTLITVPGYYKLAQSKIKRLHTNSCRAFFAIAGDVEFTARGLEIIEGHLNQAEASLEAVKDALEIGCLDLCTRYRSQRDLFLQMIGVISVEGQQTEFVKINGPLVSPAGDYACIGSGEPLANFLITGLFSPKLPRELAVRLAAYVLFHVKRNVDGCGGATQFVHISQTGAYHYPLHDDGGFEDLTDLEKLFLRVDRHTRGIIPSMLDYRLDDSQFASAIAETSRHVCEIRNSHMATLREREEDYLERQADHYVDEDGGAS